MTSAALRGHLTVSTFTARTPDGATLVADELGDPSDPVVLLLGGATWSMDWWPDELCELLTQHGLRVVRYDQRDTGQSTHYPVGEPPYSGEDLATDALRVLAEAGSASAHMLGFSMGGGLAQRLAAHHPEAVASLVLVSTSAGDEIDRDLPPPTPAVMATFTDPPEPPDWRDRDAVVDWLVEAERPYAGPGRFDEPELRRTVDRVVGRASDIAAAVTNHWAALEHPTRPVDLADVRAPALVVHGSHDPLFPLPHAHALAAALGAPEPLVLDRVGHQLPPPDLWPTVVAAVTAHVRRCGTTD